MSKLRSLPSVGNSLLRGAGHVMFQNSAISGALFLVGIIWGSYECGMPQVAWAAIVGLIASTFGGYIIGEKKEDGKDGLWGFNGVLVGCDEFVDDTMVATHTHRSLLLSHMAFPLAKVQNLKTRNTELRGKRS